MRDMKSPARGNQPGWWEAIISTFFRSTRKRWEFVSPMWLGREMPAALLCPTCKRPCATLLALRCAPSPLQQLNSIVYRNTDSDRFITFFYGAAGGPRFAV